MPPSSGGRAEVLSRPNRIAQQAPWKADLCVGGHTIHSEKRPRPTYGEGHLSRAFPASSVTVVVELKFLKL
jgi:hypothetical protein